MEQKFLIKVSTLFVGVLLLGAGALYFIMVLEGREPPPGVTLVLGLALGNIANLILGKQTFEAQNKIDGVAQTLDARSRANSLALMEMTTDDKLKELIRQHLEGLPPPQTFTGQPPEEEEKKPDDGTAKP